MAKLEFSKEEQGIVGDALVAYAGEIKKLMKKCEKMGRLKEESSLKTHFLEVEALRDKLTR